jgi:hypothetical protein
MTSITAIVMIAPGGEGLWEGRVSAACRAAAADTMAALTTLPAIDRIIVASPYDPTRLDLPQLSNLIFVPDPPDIPFHFGSRLAELIRGHALERVLYMGGGSAPLLDAGLLADAVNRIATTETPLVIANNLHSTDWAAFSHAPAVEGIAHWLTRDNMLAWRLRESAGFVAETLPDSAATRTDIDTPFDLQLLALHPRTPPRLRRTLDSISTDLHLSRLHKAVQVLQTPSSRVTLIGRVSSWVWQALEAKRFWTRVFSEERGMVASRRQADGQVVSLVAEYMEQVGEAAFVAHLAKTSDLVLFDTRVYMAHHQLWPPNEERFAADVGQAEVMSDDRLRRLVEAVGAAPIPILLGGHNVVSGGVYGLLEVASGQQTTTP